MNLSNGGVKLFILSEESNKPTLHKTNITRFHLDPTLVEISNDTDRLVPAPADKLRRGRKCIQREFDCFARVSPRMEIYELPSRLLLDIVS